MNQVLVDNWNRTVTDDDYIICLGDFAFAKDGIVDSVLEILNGKKILVVGNHDHSSVLKSKHWVKVVERADFVYNGYNIHLKHHPFFLEETIPEKSHLFIHGHTHGYNGVIYEGQIDLSVENWNYKPVHLNEVISYWEKHE